MHINKDIYNVLVCNYNTLHALHYFSNAQKLHIVQPILKVLSNIKCRIYLWHIVILLMHYKYTYMYLRLCIKCSCTIIIVENTIYIAHVPLVKEVPNSAC
jgi:hypothetical protein